MNIDCQFLFFLVEDKQIFIIKEKIKVNERTTSFDFNINVPIYVKSNYKEKNGLGSGNNSNTCYV